MADLKKLKVIRAQYKGTITRIEKFVNEQVNQLLIDCDQLSVRKNTLMSTYEHFSNVQADISCSQSDEEDVLTVQEEVEEKYYTVLAHIEKLLKNSRTSDSFSSAVLDKQENTHVYSSKLPHIDLPVFDGRKLTEFRPFIDMFTAVINDDIKLSNVQKLFYLRKYVKGEALGLVDNLPLVNESYAEALILLKKRYDNPTLIINNHINNILDMPIMQKGTAQHMRDIVSQTRQNMSALKNLKQPIEHWDAIIVCVLTRKLDQYTSRAYHTEKDSSKIPTLEELLSFLENRASALEESLPVHDSKYTKNRVVNVAKLSKVQHKCQFCNSANHKLYACIKFKLSPIQERREFAKSKKLCNICLNVHDTKCKFLFKCSICRQAHNTLLHCDESSAASDQLALFSNKAHSNVLLPTVRVRVHDKNGSSLIVRALLDSGSQTSFITADLAERLQCRSFANPLNISTMSDKNKKVSRSVHLLLESLVNNYKVNVTCSIIDRITTTLPQYKVDVSKFNIPKNILLSDDEFNIPGNISMLLAADVFFQVLMNEKIILGSCGPVLQNTLFGFIVGGKLGNYNDKYACLSTVSLHSSEDSRLENFVEKFWQTEQVPEMFSEVDSEQTLCENYFKSTVMLTNENRFQVSLPLKLDLSELKLGDSFSIALQRFNNLEKRLAKDGALRKNYTNFINEYIEMNHAKIVDLSGYDLLCDPIYFLSHHPVLRDDKKFTKLRVVFDGSMKSKNKICLNDILYNGGVVQKELFDILLLFRTYEFVFMTDIRHMYRQILIHPDHRKLQNILWRECPSDSIKCLQLQTITYGLKSSSFLATLCLLELAKRYENAYPLASKALIYNSYVDDILAGGNTIDEAIALKEELIKILNTGNFELHKWCANNSDILSDIPCKNKYFDEVDMNKDTLIIKTLGLSYDVKTDHFKIYCPDTKLHNVHTKRNVLSFISKFFDPLGIVGPILVKAKEILQMLWQCKLEWDAPLPEHLSKLWEHFSHNLITMLPIHIPRNLNMHGALSVELIGYCDASLKAYGCCIYIRAIHDNYIRSSLLCSKSRIAPIKNKLTVPRLELNSALLLSKLMCKVNNVFCHTNICKVYLFSDSKIALAWIQSDPMKLKNYVANRVKQIQNFTIDFSWYHIQGSSNPADCLSRGVDPQTLHGNKLWWQGPSYLTDPSLINQCISINVPTSLPEQKIISHATTSIQTELPFFHTFSSITKMQRIISYVLRFANNALKSKNNNLLTENIKPKELNYALLVIIRCVQHSNFSEEIESLKNNKVMKSNLKSLHPFIDKKNILRVGGRLQKANIAFAQKFPIILPKNCHVTDLIIIREHLNLLHGGAKITLSSLSQKYWIVSGIREVKKNLHKCVKCFRLKAECSQQLMGSLPFDRVNVARPFEKIGMDFCGPFSIKQSRLRKCIVSKGYVALFICFVTKAIHMELVSDLTTETFLSAFKRFISRRSLPSQVYCDNASTYKGANNQLREFYELQSSKEHRDKVENYCSVIGINFNFVPSYSPVFGGLWEAGVKSAKYHFKRVIGTSLLTYEEFNTIIIQVEGILNSRPLTAMSQDPSDYTFLTPGHFLTGGPLNVFPEPDYTNTASNRLHFWRLCSQIQQNFWKVWQNQYLVQLQNRPKWKTEMPNLKENMLVLLKDDNAAPLYWPVARIIKVIPGPDQKVRVVDVKTAKGTYRRSVTKIAVLPIYYDQ